MPTQLKLEGLSVVFRGPFTPAAFQPKWLATLGLLRETEAEEAKIEVIHNSVAVFKTSWLVFQATDDYLNLSTTEVSMYEPLRDLGISILRLFPASQLIAMGINVDLHYMVETRSAFDRVGNMLVPKERWAKVLPKPGMLTLTVQHPRPDDLDGNINVRVEPSNRMPENVVGVFVNINDHYNLKGMAEKTKVDANKSAQDILQQHWQASLERARQFGEMIAEISEEQ